MQRFVKIEPKKLNKFNIKYINALRCGEISWPFSRTPPLSTCQLFSSSEFQSLQKEPPSEPNARLLSFAKKFLLKLSTSYLWFRSLNLYFPWLIFRFLHLKYYSTYWMMLLFRIIFDALSFAHQWYPAIFKTSLAVFWCWSHILEDIVAGSHFHWWASDDLTALKSTHFHCSSIFFGSSAYNFQSISWPFEPLRF